MKTGEPKEVARYGRENRRGKLGESRLAALVRERDNLSMRRMDAAEQFGDDSPQEREALERVTDVAAEIDMVEDWRDGIE